MLSHDCTTETKTWRKRTRVLPNLPQSVATLHQSYLTVLHLLTLLTVQRLSVKGARKMLPSVPTSECRLSNAILAGMCARHATVQLSSVFSLRSSQRPQRALSGQGHAGCTCGAPSAWSWLCPALCYALWLQLQVLGAVCAFWSICFALSGGGPLCCPRGRGVLPVEERSLATGFSGGIVQAQHSPRACKAASKDEVHGNASFPLRMRGF